MNAIQYIFRIYGKESPKGSNDIINPRTLILDNIYITDVKKNHGIKIYKKRKQPTTILMENLWELGEDESWKDVRMWGSWKDEKNLVRMNPWKTTKNNKVFQYKVNSPL